MIKKKIIRQSMMSVSMIFFSLSMGEYSLSLLTKKRIGLHEEIVADWYFRWWL